MKPIFLILGSPAAGKSTVAKALMNRFERGLYVPVDDFRQMVVSGLADMGFDITPDLLEQIRLAREAASSMARLYNDMGFAVAIDDFWHTQLPHADYMQTLGLNIFRILLLPSLQETLDRLHKRDKDSEGMKQMLEQGIRHVHHAIETQPETKTGWHVVDSSNLSIEETVDRILEMTGIRNLRT
jgi:chloramphenicol 3-O-phosphotransferase